MIPKTLQRLASTLVTVATALLTACGGGGAGTLDQANPQQGATALASAAPGMKFIQAATLNADGPATVLVVRARGTLAGDVGPVMKVQVDGVEVGSVEVRTTEPADYPFTVPALKPGSKVDVVYTNDGAVNGVDRNLYVDYLIAGDTVVLPTATGAVIDRGVGPAAFDGLDVVAGQTGLYWNAALRLTWPAPNLTDRVTVRASATLAGNIGPVMALRVDGVTVGSTEVRASDPTDHVFAVPPLAAGSKVDVVYTNHEVINGVARQLNVAYLLAGTTVLLPNATGVVVDQGSGLAAFDGLNTLPGQGALTSNGALRAKWPAPNMTDRLTVRASATLAGGVGPILQVRVDGVVLGTAEVRSTTPVDLTLATLPLQPGSRIDLAFTNEASVNGQVRSLSVPYLISGKTFLLPTAPGVVYDLGSGAAAFDGANTQPGQATLAANGALRGAWPAPNLTDSLTVRAKGSLAANVGPVMQVQVNGVVVGSTEVRGTDFADYGFAVPPLLPGSQVDVVFTNDAVVNGEDRNLYVAYLISGNTSVLPNAPGTVYDRGAGAAAFDGLEVIAGQGAMVWGGALRLGWPVPNITERLTVRASGVLAGNVGPMLQVRVDGVAVSSVEVRATTPTDYLMPVPPLKPGSQIEVVCTNCGLVDGAERTLNLAYLMAGSTVLRSDAAGVLLDKAGLQAKWPQPNLTDVVTVRARGVLAGDVGPLMQLVVDGVIVGAVEVRATEPADYPFAVPPLKPGSKVDVVYTNDGVVNGVDRNLYVDYLIAGDTFVLPNATGAVLDRGVGPAAFDGLDVIAGQSAIAWNGALRLTWPAPNLTDRVTVRASATLAGNVGPVMALRVDGVTVGSTEVRATDPADHVFAVPTLSAGSKVDVVYTNHEVINGTARQLNVAYLLAGTTVLLPNATGVVVDQGSGIAAFDGLNTLPGQGALTSNGALRAKWPAPNMTDRLTVRASGRLAANVGPILQLRVDGVVVGSTEVRSTTLADYSFPVLPMRPGSLVEVAYTNDAVVNGEDRDLNIAYLISGKTFLLPTAPGVVYDQGSGAAAFDGANTLPGRATLTVNGALRGTWPVANMTDTVTVRARGSLAANVGPMMHVLVDGVVVGSTEVRNTDFADFSFATAPLQPGSQVDVAFTNDAVINGEDRNLYLAYAISGSTYAVPTLAGAVYDRGAGAAAFDGVDTLPGQGNLSNNGALRLSWPAPNITDRLTVRASATLAGNIGPVLQLRVDGVAVSSVEVSATTPTDYLMPVPPLKPGSQVDLVFSNGGSVAGVDRQLAVAYLLAGSTFVLPGSADVRYDRGVGNAAFDGVDLVPGQGTLVASGALRLRWPAPNVTDTLTVRASASLAANVGALMQLRVNGVILGTVEVRSTTGADYVFAAPSLAAGSKVDIAYLNNDTIGGQDRNLFVQYIRSGGTTLAAVAPSVQLDSGTGEAAFDGMGTAPSTGALYGNGALRFTVPAMAAPDATLPAQYAASRFLQQATFGPTLADISRLTTVPVATWIAEQMALPATPDFVNYIQGKYDLGNDYRPGGSQYTNTWVGQRFWATAATSPDQLRKRMAFALHQIFMVSQADTNLYYQDRAYASYLDTLNRYAFGNFRDLLEEVALSPAMGIYLSHMRNRKEDPTTGRLPDENFAREVMQLFSIGLHELNDDGTPKLDSRGNAIETYNNDDVMALAKVFTGWSWAFADAQLTESNFRWASPDTSAANDQRIDLLRMKPYPGQHSGAEVRLFSGKANAVVIPANSSAQDSVRIALDTLFKHPNVGPFIGRQLIQRLVTSHPSPAYVARVAARFNNNGAGVRGDLAAVVRAILLDNEARNPPAGATGKLREPVLRVAHWMRSFGATSATGQYMMAYELDNQFQRALSAPSVFGYFRPGFVPPNTAFSAGNITVPELQIVNESTTALWVNLAMNMAGNGLGWNGTAADVSSTLDPLVALAASGNVDGLIDRINLLLFDGRMSSALRQNLLDAVTSVVGNTTASHLNRARVALFLALASPEYLVQR